MKTSKIRIISKEKIQNLLDESKTLGEVLIKLGFPPIAGNRTTLNERIKEENLSLIQLEKNREEKRKNHLQEIWKNTRIPNNKVFCVNSSYKRVHLKNRIIKEKIINYKCCLCGLEPLWQNQPLSLNLDHINGVYNDNRIENLRFLCPNCHSQTETHSGKNRKKRYYCKSCGEETKGYGIRCHKCNGIENRTFEISKEKLEELVHKVPLTKIGKFLKVTDNTVRKRCKALGVEIPKFPRGYWLRKN